MGYVIGERIKKLLKDRNMTQSELADILEIDKSSLSRYIAGFRKPDPEMLANIATALDTTSDYLLDIENDEFNYSKIKRIIARNSTSFTNKQKRELINILFGDEE